MNRQPTAAKIDGSTIDLYDQHGLYLSRVSLGSEKIIGAQLNGTSLVVNTAGGRVKVYSVGEGHSPILRYTR